MTPTTIDNPTNLDAWLDEFAGQEHAPGAFDGCDPAHSWLLIEENDRGGYWLTTHETRADATEYHDTQECAGDWLECQVVDLDTGEIFLPIARTEWIEATA